MATQHNVVTMNRQHDVVAVYETTEVELIVMIRSKSSNNGNAKNDNNAQIVAPGRRTSWPRGAVVDLEIEPTDDRYRVEWHNTDNDYAKLWTQVGDSTVWNNTVTIAPPFKTDRYGRQTKEVFVECYIPRTLIVPDQYHYLQDALNESVPGDIIVLKPGTVRYDPDASIFVWLLMLSLIVTALTIFLSTKLSNMIMFAFAVRASRNSAKFVTSTSIGFLEILRAA